MHTLGELTAGTRGTVTAIENGERAYRAKLLSMGVTPGTEFEVLRVAPMGDPIEIRLRGYKLSVRRAEASIVRVQTASNESAA